MNWYYADQGHQAGPVDEVQLDELVRSGAILASTIVWRDGMDAWKPYAVARNAAGLTCISCKLPIAPRELATINGLAVCPQCQPVYIERLREAPVTALPGALPYSGFWMRFVARMADYSVLILLQTSLTIWFAAPATAAARDPKAGVQALAAIGITAFIGFAVSCSYEIYFLSQFGATPGKMLCYMKVVSADGSKIDIGTSVGRFFSRILSDMTMTIGMLMAAFDRERRALHDRIMGTRVIDAAAANDQSGPLLRPVSRAISCGHCQTSIPIDNWNGLEPLPCPGCFTPVQAIVFPAIARTLSPGFPEAVEAEGEASCYYHAGNRAAVACDECGRFLCAVCSLDAGSRQLCPSCLTGHLKNNRAPEFVKSVLLYDSMALIAAVLPNITLFGIFFTFFTAPAVVGFTLWNWKKPPSITGRDKWRFIVALIIAGFDILFMFGSVLAAILGAMGARK